MSTDGKRRDRWVDYAKAIGIALVVYGHVARGVVLAGIPFDAKVFHIIDSVIYSFHMPLFFVLSGFYFKKSVQKRSFSIYMANKIDTLVYPFLLWTILQFIAMSVVAGYTNNKVPLSSLLRMFWEPDFQFWFLHALFIVSLLAASTQLLFRRSRLLAFVVTGFAMYIIAAYFKCPYALANAGKNYIYFVLGIVLSEATPLLLKIKKHYALIFVLAAIAVQVVYQGDLFEEKAMLLAAGCSSSLALLLICIQIEKLDIRWLALLGKQSMFIYLAHVILGSGARIMLQRFFGISDLGVHLVLGTLIGLFGSFAIGLYVDKYRLSWLTVNSGRLSVEKYVSGLSAKRTS